MPTVPAATPSDDALARAAADAEALAQDPGVQQAVHAARVDIPAVIKETKAGYKTTEFWLTVVGLLAVNLNGVVMTLPDKYQAIASAVLGLGYAASRGVAKSGIPAVDPTVPEA